WQAPRKAPTYNCRRGWLRQRQEELALSHLPRRTCMGPRDARDQGLSRRPTMLVPSRVGSACFGKVRDLNQVPARPVRRRLPSAELWVKVTGLGGPRKNRASTEQLKYQFGLA